MRGAGWWMRQAYLGLIPAYPACYLVINGFRGDQFWAKPYVNRSAMPPSESLEDLVEAELDKIGDIKKAKVFVSLTESGEPRTYGGFFLQPGAELQFPVRASFENVDHARRSAHNIELDLGLASSSGLKRSKLKLFWERYASHRRKIELNSKVGEELVSRMMLSDLAKKFLVQRELQIANSGVLFCAPIFAWFVIFGAGYAFVLGFSKVVGLVLGSVAAAAISLVIFRQFYKSYNLYKMQWADEKAVDLGEEYFRGARDYFESTMKLNRLLRVVLGEEGEKNIAKNGDCKLDAIPLSTRLKHLENYWKSQKHPVVEHNVANVANTPNTH
ncbi:unnamed protein product [Cylicocyclus nassatus]|uniref:Uncharacterized protein n=1 Tax=Cylicocyclus nassatus TaxID=53992 RepID=A0AA36GWH7_CYLNA|nr:unnamed protein product [Cylicocyclus nassatus]